MVDFFSNGGHLTCSHFRSRSRVRGLMKTYIMTIIIPSFVMLLLTLSEKITFKLKLVLYFFFFFFLLIVQVKINLTASLEISSVLTFSVIDALNGKCAHVHYLSSI